MKTFDVPEKLKQETTPEMPEKQTQETATAILTEPIETPLPFDTDGTKTVMMPQTETIMQDQPVTSDDMIIEEEPDDSFLSELGITNPKDASQYARALQTLYGPGKEGLRRNNDEQVEDLLRAAVRNGLLYGNGDEPASEEDLDECDPWNLFYLSSGGGKAYLVSKDGTGAICDRPMTKQEVIRSNGYFGGMEEPEKPSAGTRFLSMFLRVITFGIFGGFESVKKYDRYTEVGEALSEPVLKTFGCSAKKPSAKLQEMMGRGAPLQNYVDGVEPQRTQIVDRSEVRIIDSDGNVKSLDEYISEHKQPTDITSEQDEKSTDITPKEDEKSTDITSKEEDKPYVVINTEVLGLAPKKMNPKQRDELLLGAMRRYADDPNIDEDRRTACNTLCDAYGKIANVLNVSDSSNIYSERISRVRDWLARSFLVKGGSPDELLDSMKGKTVKDVSETLYEKAEETPRPEDNEPLDWFELKYAVKQAEEQKRKQEHPAHVMSEEESKFWQINKRLMDAMDAYYQKNLPNEISNKKGNMDRCITVKKLYNAYEDIVDEIDDSDDGDYEDLRGTRDWLASYFLAEDGNPDELMDRLKDFRDDFPALLKQKVKEIKIPARSPSFSDLPSKSRDVFGLQDQQRSKSFSGFSS